MKFKVKSWASWQVVEAAREQLCFRLLVTHDSIREGEMYVDKEQEQEMGCPAFPCTPEWGPWAVGETVWGAVGASQRVHGVSSSVEWLVQILWLAQLLHILLFNYKNPRQEAHIIDVKMRSCELQNETTLACEYYRYQCGVLCIELHRCCIAYRHDSTRKAVAITAGWTDSCGLVWVPCSRDPHHFPVTSL